MTPTTSLKISEVVARRSSSQGYTTFVPGLHDPLHPPPTATEPSGLLDSIRTFLDPTEYAAVSLRYGLREPRDYESELESEILGKKSGKKGEALSFAEVGAAMKVSAEYARRVTSRALEKLRDNGDMLDLANLA